MKVEELVIPTPWGHIAAKAWGDKTSSPVLAIHGFHDNAATFDRLIPLLPSGFYFICLDLPSHGRSSLFPPGVNLDFLSCLREIRRVIIHLKLKELTLLSHSAGNHFSLFLASIYPELVTKVIMFDLFLIAVIEDDSEICGRLRYLFDCSLDLERRQEKKCKSIFSTMDEAVKKYVDKHLSPITMESARTLMNRIVREEEEKCAIYRDNRKDLSVLPAITLRFHLSVISNIRAPVLLLLSSESGQIQELIQNKATVSVMKDILGTHMVVKVVKGNHNVHLNNPERVASDVCRFLLNKCLL